MREQMKITFTPSSGCCRVHHFSLSEVARQNCYYCQSRHLLDETLGWFFTHVFGTHCVQPQLENFSKKEAGQQNVFITYTQCLKIIKKVSFNIASEVSYVCSFHFDMTKIDGKCDFFSRRMFPTVRCSFANLRPDMRYWVLLDIVPCDNKRYRYAYHRSSWLVAGKADPAPPHRLYPHPDAPYTGEQLRKQVVSFEKVKLTNNEMDKNGQVKI